MTFWSACGHFWVVMTSHSRVFSRYGDLQNPVIFFFVARNRIHHVQRSSITSNIHFFGWFIPSILCIYIYKDLYIYALPFFPGENHDLEGCFSLSRSKKVGVPFALWKLVGKAKNATVLVVDSHVFDEGLHLFAMCGQWAIGLYTDILVLFPQINMGTWWFIPLSKWVTTLVISGLTPLIPCITRVVTHLRSVGSSPPSTHIYWRVFCKLHEWIVVMV